MEEKEDSASVKANVPSDSTAGFNGDNIEIFKGEEHPDNEHGQIGTPYPVAVALPFTDFIKESAFCPCA